MDKNRKTILYSAIGFSIGLFLAELVGQGLLNNFACSLGYSIAYGIVGAIGGVIWAWADGEEGVASTLAFVGGLGFALGHVIGTFAMSIVENSIGNMFGRYVIGNVGYDIENAILICTITVSTFAIGGAILGLAIGDRPKARRLAIAGSLAAAFTIAWMAIFGIDVTKVYSAMLVFAVGGGALGAVWKKTPALPSLPFYGAIGFAIGFYIGGFIGWGIGFDFRPDIIGAIAGIVAGVILANRIRS